jgi:quercetin dioxygenase-like cupin family protein
MEGKPVEMQGADRVAMRLMVGRADDAPTFSMRHFTVEAAVHQFVNTGDGLFKFLCIVPVSYDCGTPTPGS